MTSVVAEMHKMLRKAFKNEGTSRTKTFKWFLCFHGRQTSINDFNRSVQPLGSTRPENKKIHETIVEFYCGILRCLGDIRWKRPDKWLNNNCLPHHDDALVHTILKVQLFWVANSNHPPPSAFTGVNPLQFLSFPQKEK